jgi:hypothetical protein
MCSDLNGTVCFSIGVEQQLVKELLTNQSQRTKSIMEAQGDVARRGVNSFIMLFLLCV